MNEISLEELKKQRKITTDRWEGKIDMPFIDITLEQLREQRKITTERWDIWTKQWE